MDNAYASIALFEVYKNPCSFETATNYCSLVFLIFPLMFADKVVAMNGPNRSIGTMNYDIYGK